MVRLIQQRLGNSIAIGIAGDNADEITAEYNALWNHNIIGRRKAAAMDTRHNSLYEDRPHDLGCPERFIYAYTTEKRLKKGLQARLSMKLAREREDICTAHKHQPGGFKAELNAELAQTLANIRTETFLTGVDYLTTDEANLD